MPLRNWLSDLLGVLYVWVNGTQQPQSNGLEFLGDGVAVAYDPIVNRNKITIVGSGGGSGILHGAGVPSGALGNIDDFYINTTANTIYGPKTVGGWGSPASLVGPAGPTGSAGATGSAGPDGNQPVGFAAVIFPTTAGTADATGFVVPASPTGNGRFLLTLSLPRVITAIVGTGTVNLRVGITTGGQEIVTDQAITSATAVGTIVGGQSLATLGASMLAANAYTLALNAGDSVKIRATTTGTLSAGAATLYVYGVYLP